MNYPWTFYFCTSLIKEDILESVASYIPENTTGNFETAQSEVCGNVPPKSVAQPCGQDDYSPKHTPLVEAVTKFDNILKLIMVTQNKNNKNTNENNILLCLRPRNAYINHLLWLNV